MLEIIPILEKIVLGFTLGPMEKAALAYACLVLRDHGIETVEDLADGLEVRQLPEAVAGAQGETLEQPSSAAREHSAADASGTVNPKCVENPTGWGTTAHRGAWNLSRECKGELEAGSDGKIRCNAHAYKEFQNAET